MIPLNELPIDKEEAAKLKVEFPRLENDSPVGCPIGIAKIRKYITAETGRSGHDLFFGRTALVGDVRFWLWGCMDAGKALYIQVADENGHVRVGCGSGDGLSPEQYIALIYARRWRDRV